MVHLLKVDSTGFKFCRRRRGCAHLALTVEMRCVGLGEPAAKLIDPLRACEKLAAHSHVFKSDAIPGPGQYTAPAPAP
jgi:hypothetical protein